MYGLAPITISNYRLYLHTFLCFLNDRAIRVASKITQAEISQFIRRSNPAKPAARHMALCILRNFTRYLYEEKLISKDYGKNIPSDNYRQQAQIPSTFSKEEIDGLIAAIDRGNPKGKRDYAIFLLALKLGFRASDIANLKFANISWNTYEFNFEQQKTAKSITLPILPEVGNALIDYLKYGRPVSSEKHVFLQVIPPYQKIAPHDVANCLRFYLRRAGINVHNRKHGPHALRHSFASCLLNNGTPLPVISEALGHTTSLSTMFYLRIDTSSLRQCALEAPRLPFAFYMQKGGYHE
jgi:site-specific recombinase XerD